MVGGATWAWWTAFHVVVAALLVIDDALPGRRRDSRHAHVVSLVWTGVLVLAAGAFAAWIALRQGRVPALQFVAGYCIETSLSVDNLFVFLIIFQGFRVSERQQHRALLWGVIGAVVLRALFIAVGVTLLQHFEWITYLFGGFLLYAAWRLIRGESARSAIPSWVRKLRPMDSLLPIIVAIEFTDLLFAVDSIPAVLGISRDPFIVYTSNIAAVLGLRSLYFVLSSWLDRLRYLHYGLGALLGFIALKMIAERWIEVPLTISLAIIGAILAVCALVSAGVPERKSSDQGSKDTTGSGETRSPS